MMSKVNDRYLFEDEEGTKTFDLINKEWIPIDPIQSNFNSVGITNLNNLIQNTTKIKNIQSENMLDKGKIFKEPINFKAYKTITNIEVIQIGNLHRKRNINRLYTI